MSGVLYFCPGCCKTRFDDPAPCRSCGSETFPYVPQFEAQNWFERASEYAAEAADANQTYLDCAALRDEHLRAKIEATQEATMALVRLKALAEWVRGYAITHDFKEYPRQLIAAEDWLEHKHAFHHLTYQCRCGATMSGNKTGRVFADPNVPKGWRL